MRRATAWIVVVGVGVAWAATPARAQAEGFWTTLAAGASGAASPSDYREFWFDTPHGPPLAVTALDGGTAQAITGGGSTFFTPPALPVLLPTGDGFATLTNIDVPNGSGGLPRFAGKDQASGAPQTGQPVPADSNRLSVALKDAQDGSKVLTVGVTDPNGNSLGQGQISVPAGGWWVIGLGPGAKDGGNPDPDPGPIGGGGSGSGGSGSGGSGSGGSGSGDPPPTTDPPPVGGGGTGGNTGGNTGGGPVTTPEPATAVLLGLGGATLTVWRNLRRRQ